MLNLAMCELFALKGCKSKCDEERVFFFIAEQLQEQCRNYGAIIILVVRTSSISGPFFVITD